MVTGASTVITCSALAAAPAALLTVTLSVVVPAASAVSAAEGTLRLQLPSGPTVVV